MKFDLSLNKARIDINLPFYRFFCKFVKNTSYPFSCLLVNSTDLGFFPVIKTE